MKNLIESFRVVESIVAWSIMLPLAGLFELGVVIADALTGFEPPAKAMAARQR